MRAEVISIKKGKMQDRWDGYFFCYKGEPFQGREKDPTDKFLFAKDPIVKDVLNLKPGMWVNLTFEKDGKFSKLVGVEIIQAPAPKAAPQAPTFTPRTENPETQRRISRSAALKEGVQIAIHSSKAATKPEVIVAMAKEIAREFEKFLNFEEEEKSVASAVGTVKTDEDFEQPPFDV